MALPIIPGVVRSSYRGLMPSGRQWANVIHSRYSGGASTPGAADIVALDALLVRLYTGAIFAGGSVWLTTCNNGVTLIDSTHYILNGTATPQIINHAATGGVATVSLPCEVAHVVTVRTARRGRSYRGRIYLPAVTTASLVAGGNLNATLPATTVSQLASIAAALGGPAVAPFWELGVASYLHSTFEPSTSFTMDVKPDVQRRRK